MSDDDITDPIELTDELGIVRADEPGRHDRGRSVRGDRNPVRPPTKMSTLKKGIAVVAALAVALGVLVVLGVVSFTVSESSDGADPDEAFSPTELLPESLGATVRWLDDAPDLARVVEPTTRDEVTAAWLRGNDALARAATGELAGLDVWFTGPASVQVHRRFDRGTTGALATGASGVSAEVATDHELRVEFYSLDGQIIVLTALSTLAVAPSDDGRDPAAVRSEVILVLSDGNWRIRNLERTD